MSAGDLTHFLLPSSRLATDVIFSVGEERIPAHKVTMSRQIFRPIDSLLVCQIYWQGILAEASQAFESFFFGPFSIQREEVDPSVRIDLGRWVDGKPLKREN